MLFWANDRMHLRGNGKEKPMKRNLKKQREWIVFEYDSSVDDMFGQNFCTEYIQDQKELCFEIDCESNLRGRSRTNNIHDAQDFIKYKHKKLKAVSINDKYIYDNFVSYLTAKNAHIQNIRLALKFDKDYVFNVEIGKKRQQHDIYFKVL